MIRGTRTHSTIAASALVIATLAACGNSPKEPAGEGKLTVQGTVGQELVTSDLRAVAVGKDRRWFSAIVDGAGKFKLELPPGQSYRILITAASGATGGKVVGRVVLTGANGKTSWVNGKKAAAVRFGVLRPTDGVAQTDTLDPSSVGTLTRGGGYDGDDHDDDDDDHDDGDDHDDNDTDGADHDDGDDGDADDDACGCQEHDKSSYDVCSAGDEKELAPSNREASKHCDDDDGDDEPAEPPCSGSK